MRFCTNYPLKCTKNIFEGRDPKASLLSSHFLFNYLVSDVQKNRPVNVSYQCIWGGGGQNKKKVLVVTYIGEQDREMCMCLESNKSRRHTSGDVPEMSSGKGTDVRCWGKKFVTMWNGLSGFSSQISWPHILTVDWHIDIYFSCKLCMEMTQFESYTFGTKTLVNICSYVREEMKMFAFAHLPQRNSSFQIYISLFYSDVSSKAPTELCTITYGRMKFYEKFCKWSCKKVGHLESVTQTLVKVHCFRHWFRK